MGIKRALVLSLALALSGGCVADSYATYGWPSNDSVVRAEIIGGPSEGSLVSLQVWKLLQVEIGLLGLSAGVGPFNAGVGVLCYEPVPPCHAEMCDECGMCHEGVCDDV